MTTTNNTPDVTIRAVSSLYRITGSRERTGQLIGMSGSAVVSMLRKAGERIQRPGRPNNQLSPASLVTAYWQRNESLRTIADRAGVSHQTVAYRMKKYGIPTRSA